MWTIGRDKPVIPRVTFIRVRCRSHIQWTNVRTAGHLLRLSSLIGMYSSQSSWLVRIHYHFDFHPKLANLWTPPLLFRRQPPQLNYPPYTVPLPDNGNGKTKTTSRVVFHLWLHKYWRICFKASHLCYTWCNPCQCKAVVKLHGVFSSWHGQTASLPPMHFHRVLRRDSAHMITPFVRVRTYLTRNFATLGRL